MKPRVAGREGHEPTERRRPPARLRGMNAQIGKRTVLVFLALAIIILILAGVYAYEGLILPSDTLPGHFYIAMTLGVIFTLAVGIGLMALLFYSSRHGYDEPPRFEK